MLTCYVWLRGSLPSFLPIALQLALDVQVTVGSLLPYGAQPSRWGHICGVKAAVVLDRNEGLVCFSFPFGLILCVGITLWVDTAFDLILDRNVVFSVSLLGWFQDLHGGLPNSGVKLGVASVPVRPVGLIFCHSTTVLHAEVTLWIKCVGQFPLLHDRRLSLLLGPLSFRMGFKPLSATSLRAMSLPACFLVVLAEAACLRKFLSLSSVLPYPMIRLVHLHCT